MPKRIDLAAQRRAIATAAIAVIGEVGLDAARLRDVAQAAQVTTGAVTHYFDGKDEVLEAALEEVVRRILAKQDAASGRAADAAGFIRGACSYLPLDAEGLAEWRVWLSFWGRAMVDERLRAQHRRYYSEIAARVAAALMGLREKRAVPSAAELRRTTDGVLAALDGVGTRATLEPEAWPARRQRETLTCLLSPLLHQFVTGRGAM